MLFGVAGGMARFLDIDPSIVRIVWALLAIVGGAGILVYIVAAIVIPEAPAGWASSTASGGQASSGAAAPDASSGAASGASGGPTATTGAAGPAWGYRAGVERRERGGGAVVLGLVLVVLGAWFLLQRFIPQIDSDVLWPVVLLLLGGALVVGSLRR